MEDPHPPPTLLYSLIAAMVLLWSANFIIGKIALREFPPLLAGGLRVALAGVFIAPVYAWQHARAEGEVWGRRDVPMLIYLGLCGIALNQLLFLIGLSRTSVAHSAFIIALTPIVVLAIAAVMKQEKMTARKMAGMLIAVSGVVFLNLAPAATSTGSQGPTLLGDFFIFLAGLTFAIFTVAGKSVTGRHSGITVNTFGFVGGGIALAPVTLWQARDFAFAQVTAAGWLSLCYMALFPSVVCYLIYYFALKHVSASRLAAFSYLQPALATLMAAFALGERITLPVLAGGALVFSGVYLAERG